MDFKEFRKQWTRLFQKWEWAAAERLRVTDRAEAKQFEREMNLLEHEMHELTGGKR